jgi:uncharacterized protein (DUF697 family)
MSRVIEVAFSGDPNAVVTKARATAERHGAKFSGDHVAGTFAGNGIEGNYRFTEKIVVVTVEKKPDFAPWPLVETAIRGFFESPAPAAIAKTETGDGGTAARRERADAVIRKHVVWSSGAGLIPVPIADVAAVTAVQVSMLGELARLYGTEASESVLQNFVTALTGGMIARLGASAIKAIPGIGTFLGAASMSILSGAATYAVGQVAKGQLERNGSLANVDIAEAKREYRDAYESGKDYVSNLDKDPANDPDVISKLERLGTLRAQGVLTEEEFQQEKARVLKKT